MKKVKAKAVEGRSAMLVEESKQIFPKLRRSAMLVERK